jgi:triosephosphate isomerase
LDPLFARILRYNSCASRCSGITQDERTSKNFSSDSSNCNIPARGECSECNEECIEPYERSVHLIVAYEPISAIGTGKVADSATIDTTLTAIKKEFQTKAPHVTLSLVYGGSVSPESIEELKTIAHVDGFLIGKASTDFQKLKNIVE